MNRKSYIDWLTKTISDLETTKEYYKVSPNEKNRIEIELNIYRICLNRIKGR